MAAVDGGGFNLEDDIGAKISGYRKEYDNDRDGRDEYGKWDRNACTVNSPVVYKSLPK